MAERSEMPDQAQLMKLFQMLTSPEEERDDAAAEMILELYGIDPKTLDGILRERLERRVEELRAQGAEVPPVMLQAIANLQAKAEPENEATLAPKDWIDNLLGGTVPNDLNESSQSFHLQSFRSNTWESLTQEDRQILEDLAAELESEAE